MPYDSHKLLSYDHSQDPDVFFRKLEHGADEKNPRHQGTKAGYDPEGIDESLGYAARMQRSPEQLKGLQLIDDALAILTDQEKFVYVAIYRDDENQEDVAAHMELTQGRVSQLLNSALKKITNYCRAKAGPDL